MPAPRPGRHWPTLRPTPRRRRPPPASSSRSCQRRTRRPALCSPSLFPKRSGSWPRRSGGWRSSPARRCSNGGPRERRPVDGYWHPELRRELKEITAQYAQILERLKGIGAQNDQVLANQQKLYDRLVRPAAAMFLTIGDPMSLTVDSVNAVAVLSFEDDHNDAVAP